MRGALVGLAGIVMLAGLLALILYVLATAPSGPPPWCECAGHVYHTTACVPPPGLPKQCYEHHDDPHAIRVW
jgi:hypothetical protein